MSFFDDLGGALSRPFERTFLGFKNVFTRPGKANLGDYLTVVFPFVGGAIASDYKHPKDIGYQAATLGLVAGGASLAAHATGTAGPLVPNVFRAEPAAQEALATIAPAPSALAPYARAPGAPIYSAPTEIPYASTPASQLYQPAVGDAAGQPSIASQFLSGIGDVTRTVAGVTKDLVPVALLAKTFGNLSKQPGLAGVADYLASGGQPGSPPAAGSPSIVIGGQPGVSPAGSPIVLEGQPGPGGTIALPAAAGRGGSAGGGGSPGGSSITNYALIAAIGIGIFFLVKR